MNKVGAAAVCCTHGLCRWIVIYIRLDEQICFATLYYFLGSYGIIHNHVARAHLFVELKSFPNKHKFAADVVYQNQK